MERVNVRVPDDLVTELDTLVELGWYTNRSEAMRDAIRHLVASYDDRDGPATPAMDYDTRSAQLRADGGGQ